MKRYPTPANLNGVLDILSRASLAPLSLTFPTLNDAKKARMRFYNVKRKRELLKKQPELWNRIQEVSFFVGTDDETGEALLTIGPKDFDLVELGIVKPNAVAMEHRRQMDMTPEEIEAELDKVGEQLRKERESMITHEDAIQAFLSQGREKGEKK